MHVYRKNPVKPHFYFGREGVNIVWHDLRLRRISTWLARKETFLKRIHAFLWIGRFYFILFWCLPAFCNRNSAFWVVLRHLQTFYMVNGRVLFANWQEDFPLHWEKNSSSWLSTTSISSSDPLHIAYTSMPRSYARSLNCLIDEQKNLIDMSSASLLLNTDVKMAETAILQDLPLHSLTTDLEPVEWSD